MCADIPEVYTITCGENVTVNKTQAMAGEMITVEATPGTNQRVASIKQNNVSLEVTADNKATFEMPAGNVNVTAVFGYEITLNVIHSEWSNSVSCVEFAVPGQTVNITATPKPTWYEIEYIKMNGATISGTSFTMPENVTTVDVKFKEKDFTNYYENIRVKFYLNNTDITSFVVFFNDAGPIDPSENSVDGLYYNWRGILPDIKKYTDIVNLNLGSDIGGAGGYTTDDTKIDTTSVIYEVYSVTLSDNILSITFSQPSE